MRVRWRGLELPSKVVCEQETRRSDYGKFIAEPFERGFGHTIGNSLRRILLSSLEGSAVTRMKLKGASHEFTSLRGVLEDVTEISLNVKALVVKSHVEKQKPIRIIKDVAGPITAHDIAPDADIEIINQDHLIATLTDNVPFELEMVVENGRGYVPATEQRRDDVEFITLDASFSPVTRVQYSVEETRVGQKTNYDRLVMQIWTDNSIDPEYALIEAAKIMRKHLNPFIQFDKLEDPVFAKAKTVSVSGHHDPALEAILAKPLTELELSVRAMNALEAEGIKTVRDLVANNEDALLEIRNFGETTLNEVKEKLSKHNLRLGMRIPPALMPQPLSSF